MPFENSSGLGNYNFYGPRVVGQEDVGVVKTEGVQNELVIDIDAAFINAVQTAGSSKGLLYTKLPAGAKVIEMVTEVQVAFTTASGSADLYVGTEGSESTNGFTVAEADLEAVGEYVDDPAGTWAAQLAADTQIGIALEGGTTATAGKGRCVIRYYKVS